MTDRGLKVAQPGKNAQLGLDTDMVFSSLFSTLPIFKIIKLDYSLAAFDFQTKTIKHGLPFVPYCLLYYKSSYLYSDRWQWFPVGGSELSPSGNTMVNPKIDKENIVFGISSGSAGTSTISIAIIVFAFPIALSQ